MFKDATYSPHRNRSTERWFESKGTVIAGCEEFSIVGLGCSQKANGIWLDYPQGTRGKAGPAASVQLQLARNNSAASSAANRPISVNISSRMPGQGSYRDGF
jgi:hypothetical protein